MNIKLMNARRTLVICLLALNCLWTASRALCQPAIPTNKYPVLNSWSFNDTNTWQSDQSNAPVSYANLAVSDFGDGNSLMVDSTNAAWLQFNIVETNGTTNLTVDQGSVIFWFAPNWASTDQGGAGPGVFGRLIEVGSYTTNASYGWWSIYLDKNGESIYFSTQTNDGTGATYLSAPISWSTDVFHQIAVTYCSTNTALYMDGALITNGSGVTIYPGPDVLTNGMFFGSDSNGLTQAHGILDDIATYTNQLDSDAISSAFSALNVYYSVNPINAVHLSPAPSSPETVPTFDAITGPGYLLAISTNTMSCSNNPNVWLTNTTATLTTNGINLTFTIVGGTNGASYDVFATPALKKPLSNSIWTWMGQGQQCVTYTIPGLTNSAVFLLLGTPQDTDGDGLTDAYELLVSHTNPTNSNTSGDGMLDGWKVLWGMNPLINNSAQASERANYIYDGIGRLETNSGINPEMFHFDAEGSIQQDLP